MMCFFFALQSQDLLDGDEFASHIEHPNDATNKYKPYSKHTHTHTKHIHRQLTMRT